MNDIAYFNGEWKPRQSIVLSVKDSTVIQGTAVSEQLRTFGGELFHLDEHFGRLKRSLEIIGLSEIDVTDLQRTATELASRNHQYLHSDDDLGLSVLVTPGQHGIDSEPTVAMYTSPLPFGNWCDKYERGEHLVVSQYRQIPTNCWPAELKCRSRMHYFLADKEAQTKEPGARALLLDQDGFVSEASTASVLMFNNDEGLVAPLRQKVLPGISVRMLKGLATSQNIAFTHRDITLEELSAADEVFLCSTSPCLLPVTSLNSAPIGDGIGRLFRTLLSSWSDSVGTDIVSQAKRFRDR